MDHIATVLSRWHGVAHRDHFLDGMTAHAVGRALHSGRLVRVRRSWYADPHADPRIVAAVRVGGTLTCVSELKRVGLWVHAPRDVHVAVPRNAARLRLADSPHARVHWQPAGSVLSYPVDSIANALAHAAGCLSPEFALVAIDCALNRRLVSLPELERTFAPFPFSHQRLIPLADAGSQSGLETLARVRLRRLGVKLRTQVAIPGVGRVDVLIGDRLVLELDGFGFHATGASFESDRRRDLALHELDFRTVRLSYLQVMSAWDEAERVILAMIRRGDHRWSRRRAPFSG